METETHMAKLLRQYDKETSYDAAAKKLLSEREILAWLMKNCMAEYKDCGIEEIAEKYIADSVKVSDIPMMPDETNASATSKQSSQVESVGQEDRTRTEGTVLYDIRFNAILPETQEQVYLIVNVEVQGNFFPGYPPLMRAVYYCCRLISSQNGPVFQHSHYGDIRKVYSIFVCTDPKAEYRNTITRFSMKPEHLAGKAEYPVEQYDLLTVVMVCLGEPEGEEYKGLLKMLHVMLTEDVAYAEKKQILESEFNIKMTETMRKELRNMCDLGSSLVNRSLEKGRVEGRAKGREEGREEGRLDNLMSNLRSLMKSMKLSLDQAMAALDVPEADRPKYRELLEQQ